jgi:hypothetical protein
MAVDIKRALNDLDYLNSLSTDDLKELLDKAAGSGELSEAELEGVSGGMMAGGAAASGCAATGGSCLACKRSEVIKRC